MADDVSGYPGATDNFTAIAALMSSVPKHSDDHKKLRDAVRNIEIELGNNPSDSDTSVRTRFVRIEGDIDDVETDMAVVQATLDRKGVVLTRSTNYNILTTATQIISWEAVGIELGGNWWTSGQTIVCPTGCDGYYSIKSQNTFTSSFAALGYHVRFNHSGEEIWVPGSGVGLVSAVSAPFGLTAGDTMIISIHNPGGSTITADGMLLEIEKLRD